MFVIFIIGSVSINRFVGDLMDRKQAKKCVRYEERVQPYLKKIDGVSFKGGKKVYYCLEWIYEGM